MNTATAQQRVEDRRAWDDSDWKLVARPERGGHRFFLPNLFAWDNKSGRIPAVLRRMGSKPAIAIADDSGGLPHLTDDGILWVDMRNEIIYSKEARVFAIPLLDRNGKKTQTVCGIDEALWLCYTYGMEIRTSQFIICQEGVDKP